MTNIDKYNPGSFCWVELATTDQFAANSFYGALFGWGVNNIPMGPNDFYSMYQLQGRELGAACTLRPEERAQGIPPHWRLYIAVDNADATAARAAQLGGKVLAPAFDVMDVGRMAVLQDPTGAHFNLWQSKRDSANAISGVDGTLCWADLNTPDPERARKFYTDLFGWKMTDDTDDDPPSGYVHIQNGEDFIGGIPPVRPNSPRMPAHWMAYFQTSNCDATAAKAKQHGARFYMEPTTMENVGRFAIVADPQGAVFAIFQSMPRK
jgi:predicted enzyme related to lactoylglutathione lyase